MRIAVAHYGNARTLDVGVALLPVPRPRVTLPGLSTELSLVAPNAPLAQVGDGISEDRRQGAAGRYQGAAGSEPILDLADSAGKPHT